MTDSVRRVTRVSAYALCERGASILLTRIAQGATAAFDGMWTLPGGGIEFGEDPRAAAIRELAEETGLIGEVDELAGVDSWTDRFVDPADGLQTDFHAIRIIYRVRVTGGELHDEIGGSSDACGWFTREQAVGMPLVKLAEVGIGLAFDSP